MSTVRRYSPPHILAILAYPLMLVVWLCLRPMPPLQDYEEWAYQGWLGARLLQGDPRVAAAFAPVHYPVPNALSQLLLTALNAVASPFLASKVLIVAMIALAAYLCWKAGREWKTQSPELIGFTLFLGFFANSGFWNGYVNYQLSILVFIGFLLIRDRATPVGVACFGIVLFACHASTFMAFSLLICLSVITDESKRIHLVAMLPSWGLLGWYILAKQKSATEQALVERLDSGFLHHIEYKIYTLSKIGPFQNLTDSVGQSLLVRSHHLYQLGVVLNIAFAFTFLAAISFSLIDARRKSWRSPLLTAGAILLAGFLLLPSSTLGVVNLGERLLYPSLLLIIFMTRSIRFLPALTAMGIVGAGMTGWQLITMQTVRAGGPVAIDSSPDNSASAKYKRLGLYAHALYVFDEKRYFLENPQSEALPPLGFDTSILVRQAP